MGRDQRSVQLPAGQTYRFGLGGIWTKSENMTIGFAYELAYGGNMALNQGSPPGLLGRGQVAGDYNSALHFFTVNVTWGPKGTTIPLVGGK